MSQGSYTYVTLMDQKYPYNNIKLTLNFLNYVYGKPVFCKTLGLKHKQDMVISTGLSLEDL